MLFRSAGADSRSIITVTACRGSTIITRKSPGTGTEERPRPGARKRAPTAAAGRALTTCACNLHFAAMGTIKVEEPTGGLRYGELACNDGIKIEVALAEKGSALGLHRILPRDSWFIA